MNIPDTTVLLQDKALAVLGACLGDRNVLSLLQTCLPQLVPPCHLYRLSKVYSYTDHALLGKRCAGGAHGGGHLQGRHAGPAGSTRAQRAGARRRLHRLCMQGTLPAYTPHIVDHIRRVATSEITTATIATSYFRCCVYPSLVIPVLVVDMVPISPCCTFMVVSSAPSFSPAHKLTLSLSWTYRTQTRVVWRCPQASSSATPPFLMDLHVSLVRC
jgi:hypothetical protein